VRENGTELGITHFREPALNRKSWISVGNILAINDKIKIQIVCVRGGSVKLGISAPREVVIDRKEIWEEKRKQKLGK
jgi:carbon storage regulator